MERYLLKYSSNINNGLEVNVVESTECSADAEGFTTPEKKKIYTQKARQSWIHDSLFKDWIIIDEQNPNFIKCKYCDKKLGSKLSTLKAHVLSKNHKENSKPFQGLQKKLNFNEQSGTKISARMCEGRFSLYIACHSAINPVNHLVGCEKENHKQEPISAEISLARTKCTAIIKYVWAPHFKEILQLDLVNSPYSLIIDEATDISNLKYIGIIIKYFSSKKNQVITTFLAIEECENSSADGIVCVIQQVLKHFKLNINYMSGLGTDNAKVMISVHKKLQELKTNKSLILVPCACHSLQLAVSHAATKSLPPKLEYLSNETYNWFSKSPKRQLLYKEQFKIINSDIEPLKIPRVCTTRWMSIKTTLKRICVQWLELKTHFGIAMVSEKCFTASVLYDLYKDKKIYLMAVFLKNILNETQASNKALQAKNCDPLKILDDLYFLVNVIAGKIIVQEKIHEIIFSLNGSDSFEEYMLPNPYLGYEFENLIKDSLKSNSITIQDEKEIRNTCVDFLKELLIQLKNRLPQNFHVLKNITIFSVQNALNKKKSPITQLLEELKYNPSEINIIQNQWSNITKKDWDETLDTTSFWIQVHNCKNSVGEKVFYELSTFVLSLLVLPFSNADVERLFSLMGLIKNKIRNRIKPELLYSIIQIREGLKLQNTCCFSYKIPKDLINKIRSSEKYGNYDKNEDIQEILDSINVFT